MKNIRKRIIKIERMKKKMKLEKGADGQWW
jgi:hypothetical protein